MEAGPVTHGVGQFTHNIHHVLPWLMNSFWIFRLVFFIVCQACPLVGCLVNFFWQNYEKNISTLIIIDILFASKDPPLCHFCFGHTKNTRLNKENKRNLSWIQRERSNFTLSHSRVFKSEFVFFTQTLIFYTISCSSTKIFECLREDNLKQNFNAESPIDESRWKGPIWSEIYFKLNKSVPDVNSRSINSQWG